jgi:hypothetical protein
MLLIRPTPLAANLESPKKAVQAMKTSASGMKREVDQGIA